jgi:uracil-DNA glycosylase family 4
VTLAQLHQEIVACRRCPRLVEYLQVVAARKKREFAGWDYWAKPLPGFGDPRAQLLLVGLAPAAHGGTRTGRMFTGDSSGAFLMRALHHAGFASQPSSVRRDDGLRLRDAYIVLGARCAPPENKPLPEEMAHCRPFLVREISLLPRVRVVVALGKIAFDAFLAAAPELGIAVPKPRPAFGHGARVDLGRVVLLSSYHPSRQNTNTGKLTPAMLDRVFAQARKLLS